eukprot:NODE_2879_length_1469_cov_40.144874_g2490_i0.p1 GENE.NODE_2879_length_1469_cov_40.144874_g2490_i0~~NODE_2879_length_1469_cov_40.144874_g2490_i0.p1  ORF type:complete len:358 (+),score=45.32 NODE_2879_length_1469_cov_40.144874_g2490_i0:40-1074(+)
MMSMMMVSKSVDVFRDIPVVISIVSILAGCSITITAQLTIHDVEMGALQTFMIVSLLIYCFIYYFVLFWHKLIFATVYCIAMAICYMYERGSDWRGADVLSAGMGVALTLVSTYHVEKAERSIFVSFKRLMLEHEVINRSILRSENVLLNILPSKIMKTLERDPDQEIIDSVSNASVMFVYIDEEWVASATANGALDTLNTVLTQMDHIIKLFQIEKVKTNPYLVVGGCPDPVGDHIAQIQRAALALMSWVNSRSPYGLKIKIGINAGPICTGIVGEIRYTWDVFGDAVNVASRLASSSNWGTITVSSSIKKGTKDFFEYESLGNRNLKGKGDVEVFRLINEKL